MIFFDGFRGGRVKSWLGQGLGLKNFFEQRSKKFKNQRRDGVAG
jgi:hypothetical protein